VTAILEWLGRCFNLAPRDAGPKSFMALAKEPRTRSKLKTSGLYIIQTDFEVSPESYTNLQAMLDEVREKYGLDFLILEPGFKLKRFDDS
jgi:hypothetical protein